ncbi:hypothetical protein Tco_0506478 [Tanacetum coccineum]
MSIFLNFSTEIRYLDTSTGQDVVVQGVRTSKRDRVAPARINVGVKELASAIVVLLSIRVSRIIGAFIASLMDENIVRLWLKEQRDAAEKLAQ